MLRGSMQANRVSVIVISDASELESAATPSCHLRLAIQRVYDNNRQLSAAALLLPCAG